MGRSLKNLPSQLPHVFSGAEARELGVGYSRLQREDVLWIAPGTYARLDIAPLNNESPTPHPAEAWRISQRMRANALSPRLGQGEFFSHHTAASIWNLPVQVQDDDRLDIGYILPARGSRSGSIRTHRFKTGRIGVVTHEGVPVLSPASTWVVLAAQLGRSKAVALGDAAIHTPRMPGTSRLLHAPLATVSEIERLVNLPFRRNRDQLRMYLRQLSPHAASPPESHLRLLLEDWEMPAPELDFDVRDGNGRLLGCSEFAYPDFRLALEYEGDHHRIDPQQWERDITKYRDYANAGWEVLRVTRGMLYREPSALRRQIWAAIARRRP